MIFFLLPLLFSLNIFNELFFIFPVIPSLDLPSSLLTTTRLLRRSSVVRLGLPRKYFEDPPSQEGLPHPCGCARREYLKKTESTRTPCRYLFALRPLSVSRQGNSSKKEVFQPHLPVRLPCYDLAPITSFALGRSSRSRTSGAPGFHGLTGGVYKARERIHRAMADARLLANPASRSRVADSDPN